MELRLAYKQTGAGAVQADWRDCDISDPLQASEGIRHYRGKEKIRRH
jgi:hypothetical protein